MKVGRRIRALLEVAVVGLLLAACGDGADPALPPAADLASAGMAAATEQALHVMTAAVAGTGAASLAAFPGLPQTAGAGLPSGRYVWSPIAGESNGDPSGASRSRGGWARLGASSDLVLSWPFGGSHSHQASLRIDWSASRPPVMVGGEGGRAQSVPAAAVATLSVDGHPRGSVHVGLGWHATPCGVVAQPDQLRASGALSGNSSRLRLRRAAASVTGSDSGAILDTSGSWSASSGPDGANVSWNVTLRGSIFRDPGSCLPTGVTVSGGRVRLHLSGAGYDIRAAATFSDVARAEDGTMLSAKVSEGRISIDGADAFTFEGTLDDANGDGVPGENVIVTTASGERVDGETFLRRNARWLLQGVQALATLVP